MDATSATTSTESFLNVTELAGQEISGEQLTRLCHRYIWAGGYCAGRDVLEVACGTGTGLSYLAGKARSLAAGDYSPEVLASAKKAHSGLGIDLSTFDAQQLPFADKSLDVVIICEALYYVPNADAFAREARRVLRVGGTLLIVNSNKDLYDFNPSPFSTIYHGTVEIAALARRNGFAPNLFGYLPVDEVSMRQRILRPVKRIAVALNLMPKTMTGKTFLKRLVFGRMTTMPTDIRDEMIDYKAPSPIPADRPDRRHKVIYCAATALPPAQAPMANPG